MSAAKHVSPQDANAKLAEGWTYVDVRTVEEFEAGHPAGAINVPINLSGPSGMRPNPDFMRVMRAAFPTDAKLIVGCKAGARSQRATQALAAEGYTNLLDQHAGWDGARNAFGQLSEPGWSRDAGLPTESGQPAGRSWPDMKSKAGA
jgi:rhodanese-related sulfurtransferase